MTGYSYQIEGIKRRSLAEEAYDYLKEQIIPAISVREMLLLSKKLQTFCTSAVPR